jgi:hypothetical protein
MLEVEHHTGANFRERLKIGSENRLPVESQRSEQDYDGTHRFSL